MDSLPHAVAFFVCRAPVVDLEPWVEFATPLQSGQFVSIFRRPGGVSATLLPLRPRSSLLWPLAALGWTDMPFPSLMAMYVGLGFPGSICPYTMAQIEGGCAGWIPATAGYPLQHHAQIGSWVRFS